MTEGTLIFKILGGLLILVGVILASNPELVSNKPVPEDIFKAVERRVWWGLFISAGTLVMFHHPLQPWIVTFVATSIAITFGLLAARLIGIMLDGSVPKQWFWVIVEAIALGGLVWWYAKVRT
jgi:4-amino-4-deoxy-L-arabinose transferase-like glycosyltransferase